MGVWGGEDVDVCLGVGEGGYREVWVYEEV